MTALDEIVQGVRHVVAQVVEPELVVGAVCDVGRIGCATLGRRHAGQDHAGVEAEEAVDAAHPLGVALGEVVVDRDDVHAVAGDRIEVRGQHAGQGLALTRLHLGDIAEVEGGAAHDLHVEVPLVDDPPGRLAGDRERLGQQLVERLTVAVAGAELLGLRAELLVGQVFDLGRQRGNVVGDVLEPLDHATFTNTEQLR